MQAIRITRRDYVSWSQISTYESCPLLFRYRYVDPAEPDFTPSALVFGKAVHAGLEEMAFRVMQGRPIKFSSAMDAYDSSFDEPLDAPVRYRDGEDKDSLRQMAHRMLVAASSLPIFRGENEIVGIEETLRATLHLAVPDCLAIVDLAYIEIDALYVVDFKTAAKKWSTSQIEDADDQLSLYEQLVEPLRKTLGLPVRLQFIVITKAKAPQIQVIDVSSQPPFRITDRLRENWKGITSGKFPAKPSWRCKGCQFQSICPTVN